MIDGVASVAMSKSMLWIYSSGKLFSEYLYNIIAIQITSKLFSNVLIVNLKNGRNVSFSIQNGFPKKAVLAINTLIYELKQGKYANIGLEQQRFCYNCGKPITGDYIFCSNCGVKLKL